MGILVRDTRPNEADLRPAARSPADQLSRPTQVELPAWYLPTPIETVDTIDSGKNSVMAGPWIAKPLGEDKVHRAETESARRRLYAALAISGRKQLTNAQLAFVSNGLELQTIDLLEEGPSEMSRIAAEEAFQAARVLPVPPSPLEAGENLLRLGCLGILGDRGADVRRMLRVSGVPDLPLDSKDWGIRIWATLLDIWLRLFRKADWADLDAVLSGVSKLRDQQSGQEPGFLEQAVKQQDSTQAWSLVTKYHLAKAAEILGVYHSQGSVDGHFDIYEQLDAHFDRAIAAAGRGGLLKEELFARLLAPTARRLAENSIWTATRAVNSRVTRFVQALVSREQIHPIFELLPPQGRTLREHGLLGSGRRSIVVSLPTSSGKTYIAIFRILQALNQFEHERGWVAYLAPTRALVNQLTVRLRREFGRIGDIVEKVSPALEINSLEADLLGDTDAVTQFRILVTTPEKLGLILRGGWADQIGRPLTLVVVDEAHGIGIGERGLRLELLLATINRECKHAQFLLLTLFVPNGVEISRWLAPESHRSIDVGADWMPNDCVVALSQPRKGCQRGDFSLRFSTQDTIHQTLHIPEDLEINKNRPLGLSWSQVSRSPGKLAAATAEVLQHRGTVIVLVDKPRNSWGVAKALRTEEKRINGNSADHTDIRTFLADEMGPNFPLTGLLEYGIGIHHSGLSDDTRTIVEWLTERSKLHALVATTTISQGVNFPVSGVIFASYQDPYGQDIPPTYFWNVAGRAGHFDRVDLGFVALVSHDRDRTQRLHRLINRSVKALNSTLIKMVQEVADMGNLLRLESLAWQPGWSAFLQYLAHTYRQIGDDDRFAMEVEQVLRGTLGFRKLRSEHSKGATQLVEGVYRYAERIQGKPLRLVDATGFSWESVSGALARLKSANLMDEPWSPDLFSDRRNSLQRLLGVLFEVPELRKSLAEVTGGPHPDGDTLTRIICDWVHGRSLPDMANSYFAGDSRGRTDQVRAMTRCCQNVFGRLTRTASWGLAALQALTLRDGFESLPPDELRSIRNLPAKVYYGVNSDEAVALRLLGVPRSAAEPLAAELGIRADGPLHRTRAILRRAQPKQWTAAIGSSGAAYRRVWSIIEGEA